MVDSLFLLENTATMIENFFEAGSLNRFFSLAHLGLLWISSLHSSFGVSLLTFAMLCGNELEHIFF